MRKTTPRFFRLFMAIPMVLMGTAVALAAPGNGGEQILVGLRSGTPETAANICAGVGRLEGIDLRSQMYVIDLKPV